MSRLVPLFVLLLFFSCKSGDDSIAAKKASTEGIQPADVILRNEIEPVSVQIVGTWHFDYPGLDSYKVKKKDQVDIGSDKRQQEVLEAVAYLAQFKPTMVCLEVPKDRQQALDSVYQLYLKGEYTLKKNEVFQLGFRLGKRLGLKRLYAVDAGNFFQDHHEQLPEVYEDIFDYSLAVDSATEAKQRANYQEWYAYRDEFLKNHTVLEMLKYTNDPEVIKRTGSDMVQKIQSRGNKGPDLLATRWYSRNMRIANNVINLEPSASDRVMLLFGSSHVPVLQHFFAYLPAYELKTFSQARENK